MDTFLHLLFLVLLMDVHSESVSYETTQLIQCKIWYIFALMSSFNILSDTGLIFHPRSIICCLLFMTLFTG